MTIRKMLSARFLRRSATLSLCAVALGLTTAANAQFALPTDPLPTCTVTSAEFNGWFTSHTASLNGVVDPADSIGFSNPLNNCAFYKWTEQMFFWLASPAPAIYGGGDRIFNSPTFYDVTPPNGAGRRQFQQHVVGLPRLFPIRVAQVGPNHLPVIMDKAGELHEVLNAPTAPSGNPLVRLADGKTTEIARISVARDGTANFLDHGGKPIAAQLTLTTDLLPKALLVPRTVLPAKAGLKMRVETLAETNLRAKTLVTALSRESVLQKFTIDRTDFFISFATHRVVPVEQGQADGSVLLSHGNSLIYFATIVNDVYAYYLTGRAHGAIAPPLPAPGNPDPGKFPISQANLTQITTFAGKQFVDNKALAIEVKTAWVDASTLPDPQNYITTMASVPGYTHNTAAHWTPTGTMNTIKVALLGMHVVGSTNGHSEMLWGTFEHVENTPRASFQYNATTGVNPHTVNPSHVGNWVLSANGSAGPFNVAHANYFTPPDINGSNGFNITGSDTMQEKVFGAGFNQKPNPLIASTAESNTQVISLNVSVANMMAAAMPSASADLRLKYIQSGTTWTAGGAVPNGRFPAGNEVGTSRLANTTMETYQQGPDNNANGANCFSCHHTNTTDVSHVFNELDPLF